jgi:hypothetical protein
MPYNLKNRSFLKLLDFSKRDLNHILNLVIDLGDSGAKDRLRTLRTERERVAQELSQLRIEFPAADELMPRLREKLREFEATLKADVARGRYARVCDLPAPLMLPVVGAAGGVSAAG